MVRPVICVPAYEAEEGLRAVSFGGTLADGGAAHLAGSGPGRRAFSKVPSLLFDLEDLEEGTNHKPSADAGHDSSLSAVLSSVASLLEPWSESEYMLLVHVRLAREDAAKRGAALTVTDLADTLRRLGYLVKIRTALGGGWGGACLRNLRHTFLTVDLTAQGGSGKAHYILDPKFREQFEVAHPTPRYRKVMEGLGQEVLATPDRLTKVVELLCHEITRTFAETGTPVPPWRQMAAMLSKWQPRRSEDTDVLPCPASFLNNALGMLSPKPAAASGTVAQRMTALGTPVPALHGPSPIPEGLEDPSAAQSLSTSDAESPRTVGSAAGSVHVGWPEDLLEDSGPTEQVVPAPALPATAPVPARANAHGLPPLGAQPMRVRAKPVEHVWEGIRQAVKALPGQRNTWA